MHAWIGISAAFISLGLMTGPVPAPSAAPVLDSHLNQAQQPKHQVKLNELIQETQKQTPDSDSLAMVWWIPNEYWEAALGQDPTVSKEVMDEVLKTFEGYTLIAAVDGKISSLGTTSWVKEPELRRSIKLIPADGKKLSPLAESGISDEAKQLIDAMKPVMASVAGPMGTNMHFFFFKGQDDQGERLLDPKSEGAFTVTLGTREFKWRLPLGALLPSKTCPKCTEDFSGAFNYCPYDGTKLPGGKGDGELRDKPATNKAAPKK